jgi:ApbE superfamily uncharacterized protein (UPF0280 family)
VVRVKKTDYLRTYRASVAHEDLVTYGIVIDETDLLISSATQLAHIQSYAASHPSFLTSLRPLAMDADAPPVVSAMLHAARCAGVGPMAAVAGAIAEHVGADLLADTSDVIIENGGDLFIATTKKRRIGTFAGTSSFSGKIFFDIPSDTRLGICTSSGTVGYSFSYGRADAVTVIAPSAALADAAATAVCNRIVKPEDIEGALAFARQVPGVSGVLAVIGEDMGMWGCLTVSKESAGDRIVLRVSPPR